MRRSEADPHPKTDGKPCEKASKSPKTGRKRRKSLPKQPHSHRPPLGLVSWASLAQGVCLSAILATRDALTPLKVVFTAAALNCLGDLLFCCYRPWGVAGAAAATALSTLAGFETWPKRYI